MIYNFKYNNKDLIVRESGIELLRILAMSLIVIHHFMIHTITPKYFPLGLYNLFAPWFLTGVNLFFLISGYFQVNYSLKNILKLTLTILFFVLINWIALFLCNVQISYRDFIRSLIFPISESPYWFIAVYYILLIISPLLNISLKQMTDITLGKFLLVFTFVNIYSCGLGYNFVNSNGYSLLQCIYLYVVATYLRRTENRIKFSKSSLFLIFLLATISNCLLAYIYPTVKFIFHYNNIFLITASVSLFILFSRFHFRNRIINSIASAALGCYLLQDGTFGNLFFYNYLRKIYLSLSLNQSFIIFSSIFVGIWIISWLLSNFQRVIVKKTIIIIENYLPKKFLNLFALH